MKRKGGFLRWIEQTARSNQRAIVSLPAFLLYAVFCIIIQLNGCGRPKSDAAVGIESEPRSARLVFIGDVMSHTPQVSAARADAKDLRLEAGDNAESFSEYDYTEVFRHMEPIFEPMGREVSERRPTVEIETVVVANLETTLRTEPPYTGYPSFAAPAELAFAMRRAGIDIVTTANNHICDKGARGIRRTLGLLDSAGLRHTGAFRDSVDRRARNPLIFEAGGLRFALLNYTYGTNGIPVPKGLMVNLIDTTVIACDLARVRRDASGARGDAVDCVIVSYHWGEEYRHRPVRAQKELAAWTRARGADIVMGGHPHVVEPFEAFYNADSTAVVGAVYYSLGNFVSNQRRRYTDGGMVAEIVVTKTTPVQPTRPTLNYDLGYRLLWVYTPVVEGVMRYVVLPSAVADTMPDGVDQDGASDRSGNPQDPDIATARRNYDRFMRDSRKLLSGADSVFRQL